MVSPVPLKKRPRMMEVPYGLGHAINKNVQPVLAFTFEEEFKLMDYIVRIEQYQNRRYSLLQFLQIFTKTYPREVFKSYKVNLCRLLDCTGQFELFERLCPCLDLEQFADSLKVILQGLNQVFNKQ